MANSTESLKSDASSVSYLAGYTSMILQLYLETLLKQGQDLHVLDVGPVCEENIRFFAQRVKKLYVCDLFVRLDQNRRKDIPNDKVWKQLDYPVQSFHGINLWDLLDHLEDRDANQLVELCHRMLKPKGLMMIITFEERLAPSLLNTFVVRERERLTLRPLTHLNLPWYYRSNRELALLLAKFSTAKSFLYRNRIREFLLQRD